MNNYTVYCHISPSGKMYVGITSTSLEKRWSRGNGYKNNTHFWRAIQLYGWDAFSHEVLAEQLTYEQATDLERHLIEIWELTDPQKGYNISKGDGCTVTEETRRRMSEAQKGNKNSAGRTLSEDEKCRISESLKQYYTTHDNPRKGCKLTEEEIKKLKERPISEETRLKMSQNHADFSGAKNPSARPIIRIDQRDGTTKFYSYATEAAKELGIDLSAIIKCCRGKKYCKTVGGFIWRYADEVYMADGQLATNIAV